MKRMMAGLALAVGMALMPVPTRAYTEVSAANVFSHEVLTCVAYYTLLAGDLREVGENMEAYKYFVTASSMLKRARALVPMERVREKLDLITAKMTARRDEGGRVGAMLDHQYESLCRKVDASPEARLKYWRDKR